MLTSPASDEPLTLRLDVRGPAEVTAGDIQANSDVEILNKDLHIATLNAKARLAVDLTVDRGKGLPVGAGSQARRPSASSRSTPSSRRCGGSPSRSSRPRRAVHCV